MSLIFMDGFDHYSDLGTNYDYQNANNFIVTGHARTGLYCLYLSSYAYGPARNILDTSDCLVATCCNCTIGGNIMQLGTFGAGAGLSNFAQGGVVILVANGDGSISVTGGVSRANQVFGTSAAGLVRFGVYNSFAMRTTVGASARTRVYVNGTLVLDLNGYDNRNLVAPARTTINCFMLMAPPGNLFADCYHDDVYVLDCGTPPNDGYLGALRIYTGVPDADGAVQWAPSLGAANFANVDSIPPNQATEFNSSGTSGQADQYRYPLPSLPGGSQIFAVQHCQDVQVDSGSQSVTSDVGGVVSPLAVNPGNGWQFYTWPYDVNPVTGSPWALSDFPAYAGPRIP